MRWTNVGGLAAAVLSAAGCYYSDLNPWGSASVKLPDHLVAQDNYSKNEPICAVYETLFKLDARYHDSHPDLYKLVDISAEPPRAHDKMARNIRLGLVIAKLDVRTRNHYKQRDNAPRGSAAWNKASMAIAAWTRVGAVLLSPKSEAKVGTMEKKLRQFQESEQALMDKEKALLTKYNDKKMKLAALTKERQAITRQEQHVELWEEKPHPLFTDRNITRLWGLLDKTMSSPILSVLFYPGR
ncbi:hypothetical protein FZEAL_7174 [Fusarium zealandicum]|uniref:Uncharacterized protein n=1 Tax=Fusarium zealandicum TaxID=1053134 RepID=A0A8H4XJ48_9HYPO|nr:hypothetical protein FZEAL_7174 [Fusarium zealandicum]